MNSNIIFENFDNNENTLLITFSPSYSDNKFLFYRSKEYLKCNFIFFNDVGNNFYLEDIDKIIRLIESAFTKNNYKRVIIIGFSAGAFISLWITKYLDLRYPIDVYAFSPHLQLFDEYSECNLKLSNKFDLSEYSLIDLINTTNKKII